MGCSSPKQVSNPQKQAVNLTKQPQNRVKQKLKHNWTCPNCMTQFISGSQMSNFKNHITTCITFADNLPEKNNKNNQSFKSNQKNMSKSQFNFQKKQPYIFEKNLQDEQGIRYSWVKVKQSKINPLTIKSNTSVQQIRKSDFQTKQKWFRNQVEKLRINWVQGCQKVAVDPKNILMSSIQQFRNVNLHKQVKITFKSEKTHDAGGLLRQWVHLVIKQIFSSQLGFFVRADTQQLTYKLRPCQYFGIQFGQNISFLYGQILGKALFQKIPISTYMDRTLIRQLCDQQIQLSDVFTYDKQLYSSWTYILNNNMDPQPNSTQGHMQFYYTINLLNQKTGKCYDHQLVTGGQNVLVTEQNKNQYIKKSIKFMCQERIKKFLDQIKSGLYSVVPKKLMSIFEPHELQMLIYGVPFIDIQDWQTNIEYLGAYHPKHKTILWFWQFMISQQQQKLSKLLQFCTGTTRVPLNGFKKLETNRGEHSKFVIQSAQYNEKDPYPKGHTCFNRLQLPVYPNKKSLQKYLSFILEADLEGVYGLD